MHMDCFVCVHSCLAGVLFLNDLCTGCWRFFNAIGKKARPRESSAQRRCRRTRNSSQGVHSADGDAGKKAAGDGVLTSVVICSYTGTNEAPWGSDQLGIQEDQRKWLKSTEADQMKTKEHGY